MAVKGSAPVVIPLQLHEVSNRLRGWFLTYFQAAVARDSLAKTLYHSVFLLSLFLTPDIYSQLFAWIVKTINAKIDPPEAEASIGILDIFGFEQFQVRFDF